MDIVGSEQYAQHAIRDAWPGVGSPNDEMVARVGCLSVRDPTVNAARLACRWPRGMCPSCITPHREPRGARLHTQPARASLCMIDLARQDSWKDVARLSG